MVETGTLSVRSCVGSALRFVRETIRFTAASAAIGALLTGLLALVASAVPQLGVLTSVASTLVQAFIYAGLIAAALYGAQAVRGRIGADGGRVWAAMAIIGFFMFIVVFVISLPVAITLAAGPLRAYAGDLQAAGSDQSAVMQIMLRFIEEQPGAVLITVLFYFVIWFLLTSRLYLAAPASVDHGRILTFETWKWTKGAMLRIVAARFMLLAPAYLLVFALSYLAGYAFGINPSDPASMAAAAESNRVGFLIYAVISSFMTFLLYTSLEAGLSAAIYRALKPAEATPSVA